MNRCFQPPVVVLTLLFAGSAAWAELRHGDEPGVSPRPRFAQLSGRVVLAAKKEQLRVALRPLSDSPPLSRGMAMLSGRLGALGYRMALDQDPTAELVLRHCDDKVIGDLLVRHGGPGVVDRKRLSQAYHLSVGSTRQARPIITLESPSDLGLFYALTTLCQLLTTNEAGDLTVPAGTILDLPETGNRMVKISGSTTAPDAAAEFAEFLSLCKLNQLGLQYHGERSRKPDKHFTGNIERLCPQLRREGLIESIIYFCPFRGKRGQDSYDLALPADRTAYTSYLLRILSRGAHGIEVDYNDWAGNADVPIADVLNLVCDALAPSYPDAYLLYCPPLYAREHYHGMPTPELTATLSRVPAKVWPLWTGMEALILKPLETAKVEEWTRLAGRRPFLWVNRVGPAVNGAFSRPLDGRPEAHVFRGELLPKDLGRLFEGVHLNAGPFATGPRANESDRRAELYLLTAADYLWNPHDWTAEDSYRRASRFVRIMGPLTGKAATMPGQP